MYFTQVCEQESERVRVCIEECVCERVGAWVACRQGKLGEWEVDSCHSLECGRGETLSDSFA